MRRKIKNKRPIKADTKFDSTSVAKFMNYVMYDGKKNTARTIMYDCLEIIKDKAKVENPIEIFEAALKNTAPQLEVRSRRVGGANYQVPVEVRPERRAALSMKWIVIAASNNEGEAVKKRENVHKMAEANKAFAHFAW